MPKNLQTLLELARVSNLPTVLTNVVAAWVLADGNFHWHLLPLILGAALVYSGGMILNDAADAKWDRHHRPERPIPSGKINARLAYLLAGGFLGVGVALCLLASASPLFIIALILAIVGYDLLHKRHDWSVWLMGACRMLLYVVAGSAAGEIPAGVIIWGAALGAYTVGITLAAQGEAADAPAGRLPHALFAAPVAAAVIMLFGAEGSGVTATLVALVAFGAWVAFSVWTMKRGGEGRVGKGVGLLIAGMILLDATAIAAKAWPSAIAVALVLPATLVAQRRFAAT